mmetsp:Transcript_8963/g.27417  ORF Transcript_8963/g.27417 Transcript_8963/m.27417 type:complete len:213 (+) Transcript_8963:506-1144(+)
MPPIGSRQLAPQMAVVVPLQGSPPSRGSGRARAKDSPALRAPRHTLAPPRQALSHWLWPVVPQPLGPRPQTAPVRSATARQPEDAWRGRPPVRRRRRHLRPRRSSRMSPPPAAPAPPRRHRAGLPWPLACPAPCVSSKSQRLRERPSTSAAPMAVLASGRTPPSAAPASCLAGTGSTRQARWRSRSSCAPQHGRRWRQAAARRSQAGESRAR